MNISSAVILAGGFGTRMTKKFPNTPKPLIPVNEIPILEHVINECKRNDIQEILCVLHNQPKKIIDYFGDGNKFGLSISYHIEKEPKGTAGALLEVKSLLKESFLVLYADVYIELNLKKFLDFHKNNDSKVSIIVHPNDHPFDSDIVIIDKHKNVKNFSCHPHHRKNLKNLVNAAVYVIDKSCLDEKLFIKQNKLDIAQDFFPALLKSGIDISTYKTCEYIKDMGTPDRLLSVEQDIKSGVTNSRKLENRRKAIFLDRDGTINIEKGHIASPDKMELIECAGKAIKKINRSKFLAICVTNQPVIARGECTFEDLDEIHNKMETELGKCNSYLDDIYFCPHHQDSGFEGEKPELKINCNCRKPQPGMLIEAKIEHNIDLDKSWLIGNSVSDIEAANRVNCKSILISNFDSLENPIKPAKKPTKVLPDIESAVNYILDVS